jgi:hypothetical protein
MAATRGKPMKENQGRLTSLPEMTPMTAMTIPLPFLMLAPIGALSFAVLHRVPA